MAKAKKPALAHVRDADTGRYVEKAEAIRRPKETVTERDKAKPRPPSKKK